MESDDKVMWDIIKEFVLRGQDNNALWPEFAEAVKDCIAVLEGNKMGLRLQTKGKHHSVSDEEDAESSSFGDTHSPSPTLSSDEDDIYKYTLQCAYCDEHLPLAPTQQIKDVATALELVSIPDPISGNPGHCKTSSFKVSLDYCARHCVECDELPLACLQKWPEMPDFAGLHDHILKLCPQL
jgi:hypothetical protein